MRLTVGYIFMVLIVLASGCATAQRNAKTVKEDGDNYFVHTVEKGNTLYGISHQYSVDVSALINANPGAQRGLKVGQRILVPVDEVDKRKLRKTDVEQKGDSLFHTVQRKETLFSISQDYNVPVNALRAANPGSAAGIDVREKLYIPVDKVEDVEKRFTSPASRDSLKIHSVSAGETLFSISRMYNVNVDSLRKVNPQLASPLKVGATVRIPVLTDRYKKEKKARIKAGAKKDSLPKPLPLDKVYRVALMLPFNLDDADSLLHSSFRLKNPNLDPLTRVSLDYYRGTRLAMDSLEERGFNARLHVYMVHDVVDANQVVKRAELDSMHLIIGPLHRAALAEVSEFSRKHQIPLVSPNALMGSVIEDNPLLINPAAGEARQIDFLADQIKKRHAGDRIILVNSNQDEDARLRMTFRQSFTARKDSTAPVPVLHELSIGNYGLGHIRSALSSQKQNVLVVPSQELAYVSNFMTRMSQLSDDSPKIIVYGLDSWLDYNDIEATYKNRFHLRLPSPSFVDYDNERVIRFLKAYRKRFNTEPGSYGFGFTAYDIGLLLGRALQRYGPDFPMFLPRMDEQGLKAEYHLVPSRDGSGYENEMVYLLEYDNYEIKRIGQ